MTGRDGGADLAPAGNTPVVILVRPQLIADGLHLLVAAGEVVLRRVDTDSIKPGIERRIPPELGQGAIGLDEGFLRNVLDLLGIAHHA